MIEREWNVQVLKLAARECEWVEFKVNNAEPDEIGEYISALANSAALHGEERAYLIWGIEDETRAVVGTTFRPRERKIGNEELESWLTRQLTPRVDFRVQELQLEDRDLVVFEIRPCRHTPVRFKETEYIRIGSYKKKLKDFPEKERELWLSLSSVSFEKRPARSSLNSDDVLRLIDYPAFFELLSQALPDEKSGILERLEREKVIERQKDTFSISNLGALLFARKLADFEDLSRKAVRVVIYKGKNRVVTIKEQVGGRGYAVGFEGLITYINDQLPTNEHIGKALRSESRMYPELAIRELVANAIIHQDLNFSGDSPLIEIFEDRIEITNSGRPLIETLRFIDEPPQSRNEALAAFMRRLNMCEERGSGIDKVISSIEDHQLPAPLFSVTENHTRVTLFSAKKLTQMDRKDKIRACYQHACLKFVSNERMTNGSLRQRLGIEEQNYAIASRIIGDTIAEKLVKASDPDSSSRKYASYIPYWA